MLWQKKVLLKKERQLLLLGFAMPREIFWHQTILWNIIGYKDGMFSRAVAFMSEKWAYTISEIFLE